MNASIGIVVLVALAGAALGGAGGEPAKQDESTKETLKFGELPKNTGWLSDPAEKADDPLRALVGGKIHLNNRLRFEFAEADGRKPSYAITNRLRLGYESKPWHGLSGMIEMEHVATPDEDLYFVPATGDGDPARTGVADPADIEINQAWGRYRRDNLAGTEAFVDLKGGRQRIIFDNSRFVGNVGWRQFEQTFDAARVELGSGALSITYAYIWHVQRIFSDKGPNFDSDSHLIRGSIKAGDRLTIAPFLYLLDFDESPLDSQRTFGAHLTGSIPLSEEKGTSIVYSAAYARQTGHGNNPVDYDADYFQVDAAFSAKGVGTVGAGFEYLGSDGGRMGFRFPLGTNHAFNGWADLFLVTPAEGLQDFYIYAKADLPWGVQGAVYYHRFWFAEGGDDLGWELDGQLSKSISRNWSVLAKVGWFDGRDRFPDTIRVWAETTFSF